ncbi:UNVERIFIED_ORG: vanillate O-demethylase ferredoxin subunit [Pantoea allii]|uniref:PDR/VanB family oxidoreductase n=1 Tax=Enterobacter agglomerans TaxID=549 RepID=UPI00057D8BB2|nr:PDR/VanB family oxidoreductase [Pantoea agglomerans]KIC86740.1 ferredoxin [Pantoea agglomerans]MBA5702968.1 oxidoreductase [Pantoea agglomerans]SUB03491.1 Phthalate dioxygenase reductase [Pantoea agglomerans]
MKDAGLIPVTIRAIGENGKGNISLQFVAQHGGLLPSYLPGAHIDVFIPDLGARQYSLCTENHSGEYYEICVKLADNSTGGSHFIHHHFSAGDKLTVSAPRNHFPLPSAGRYLLFAGGIGITPLLTMAEQLAQQQIEFELHYYIADQTKAAFIPRLKAPALAKNLFLHDSRANDSLRNTTPLSLCQPDENTRVMACGPDGFIQRLEKIMQAHHWQKNQLSFERFSNAKINNDTDEKEFHIQLASTGERYLVGPNQSIAEVLLSAKVDIMLSCEQGICGSCITDVIDGIPDHRDCVLTDEEKAENTQITLCCSRAKSPILVLDL